MIEINKNEKKKNSFLSFSSNDNNNAIIGQHFESSIDIIKLKSFKMLNCAEAFVL